MRKQIYVQSKDLGGSRSLAENAIWNVPSDTNELRLDIRYADNPFHDIIVGIRGLAMTLDGKVFGIRSLTNCRESGYHMEGRVSIGNKKYRAFTCSTLFERADGSLVSVGTLVVCGYEEPTEPPCYADKLAMFRASQALARSTRSREWQVSALAMLALLTADIGAQPEP